MPNFAIGRFPIPVLASLCAAAVPCCLSQPFAGRNAPQSTPCVSVLAPARTYSIKLIPFVPEPNHWSGALLEARINGGPPLHLLLDSGAAHITLDARASAKSAVAAVAESHLVGVGETQARIARTGMAGMVDAGPVQFRDCRVDVAPTWLAGGIDGVIPMSLFGGFLIRLDLPGKALELMPYPKPAAGQTAGFETAILREDMLFLRAAMNDALEGYILLDTGACYSAVSWRTAQALRSSLLSAVDLRGPNGAVNGGLIDGGIRFHVAGRSLTAEPVVALDLAAFSAFNGVETAGVLGYPTLRSFVLTLDYRDALVRIDAPSKAGNAAATLADRKNTGFR